MKPGVIANALVFQGNWFVVILGAAAGRPWLGVVSSLAFVLGFAAITRRWAGTLTLAAASALVGYAADSALVLGGVLSFPGEARLDGPSTLWMVALWAAIACTLHSSMRWLQGRPALGAVFGALGGAGSYFAGMRLGAVDFPAGDAAGAIAAGGLWLVAMPLLAWLAPRLDPAARPADPAPPPASPAGPGGSETR